MPISFIGGGIVPVVTIPANALYQRDGTLILDRAGNNIQTR